MASARPIASTSATAAANANGRRAPAQWVQQRAPVADHASDVDKTNKRRVQTWLAR
jgi:hypothetical protein